MNITPIACTGVSWASLQQVALDMDKALCARENVGEQAICLGLGSQTALHHFYVSYCVDFDNIAKILELGQVSCLHYTENKYLLTASLFAWVSVIESGLVESSSTKLRKTLILIYSHLRDNGVIFTKKRVPLKDGTFAFQKD